MASKSLTPSKNATEKRAKNSITGAPEKSTPRDGNNGGKGKDKKKGPQSGDPSAGQTAATDTKALKDDGKNTAKETDPPTEDNNLLEVNKKLEELYMYLRRNFISNVQDERPTSNHEQSIGFQTQQLIKKCTEEVKNQKRVILDKLNNIHAGFENITHFGDQVKHTRQQNKKENKKTKPPASTELSETFRKFTDLCDGLTSSLQTVPELWKQVTSYSSENQLDRQMSSPSNPDSSSFTEKLKAIANSFASVKASLSRCEGELNEVDKIIDTLSQKISEQRNNIVEKDKPEIHAKTKYNERNSKNKQDSQKGAIKKLQRGATPKSKPNEIQEAERQASKAKRRISTLRELETAFAKVKPDEQRMEITRLKYLLEKKSAALLEMEEERHNLLLRLSALAGAKLTEDNPSIADLSDSNRPTKLAEKYSELYANQWTDAYTEMENTGVQDEEKRTKKLLEILLNAYNYCDKRSVSQISNLKILLYHPTANVHNPEQYKTNIELTPIQSRQIKELQKGTTNDAVKDIIQRLEQDNKEWFKGEHLANYSRKCIELCWLMNVQTPPVYVDSDLKPDDPFDTKKYAAYTKKGKVINFVVWPHMSLVKGGATLAKGVAQGS